MKRIISSALVLGLLSLPAIGLVGCGDEAKKEETKKEVVTTPGGGKTETTHTETDKVKSSGDNPPPNSAGETAKTAK